MDRVGHHYTVSQAILFGSRARRNHHSDSDADIAVVIRGAHGSRSAVALEMAGMAFEVLLDTGVLIEARPLWEDELEHPERFGDPALIESIRKEGIRLWA
jgi:predicted nucleotidyltransferase